MTEEEFSSPFDDADDGLAFSAGIIVSDDEGVGDAKDGDMMGDGESSEGAVGLWGDGVTRDRLRSRLARRWAKYVGRWYDGGGGGDAGGGGGGSDETAAGEDMQRAAAQGDAGAGTRSRRRNRPESGSSSPRLQQIDEDRDAEMEEEARAMEREMERNMAVDEGYMSEEVVSTTVPSGGVAQDKRKTSQQRPKRPGPEPLVMSPYRTVVREPTKGRAQDLVDGRMSKRRKYRHSWRAPDRDLFTVVEEQGEGGDASEIGQRYFSAF